MVDAALLLLRTVTGGLLAGHGAQKLFGAFDGPGLDGTRGMMGKLGLEPADAWGTMAAGTEFAGGTLTALGLLSPLGPIVSLAPMAAATTLVHRGKPIWASKGGAELPLTYAGAAGALALSGSGRFSLDHLLGIRVPRWVSLATLAGVVGGSAAVVVLQRQAQMRREADEGMAQQLHEPEQAAPQAAEEQEVELSARGERARSQQAGTPTR